MLEQCFACVLLARVLDPFAQRGLCCFKRRVENVARQGAEGLAVAGDVAVDAIVNRRVEVEDVIALPHHRVRNVRRGFLAGNPPYITNGAALGVLDAEILRALFDLFADGDLFASMVFLRLRGFAIFATVAAQKGPPFCDGPVSGETPRSHLQRRKLTTFRPGRLCLFTHSTLATAGQINPRDHAVVDGIRFGDLGQGVSPPGVLAFQATAPTSNCSYPQTVL